MTREEAITDLELIREEMYDEEYGEQTEDSKKFQESLDMAIFALSAEGEYIKKEDLFNKTVRRNSIWNGTTNAEGKGLEEIVNDLPTYTFPDREKGEWKKIWRDDCECSEYVCSKCDCGEDYVTDFCPNCGADMRGKANE